MKLYLVRHGEAESNVSEVTSRNSDSSLTKKGREQAEFVGKRFLTIPIEQIVSSTYLRAKETAEIISEIIKIPIVFSEAPIERGQPTAIYGLQKTDPKIKEIYTEVKNNFHIPSWNHSGEETYEDLMSRARETLKYVLSLEKDSVLLVTHGIFKRVLIAYMIFGEELSPRDMWRFMYESFNTKNTGITLCAYNEEKDPRDQNGWRIVTWNDHAHLGEVS